MSFSEGNIFKLEQQFDSSKKAHKGKLMSGAKARATKRYFKDQSARARRKQRKTRFDSYRREEQPNAQDELLENLHYANFLGVKKSAIGVLYNNDNNECINLGWCDICVPIHKSADVSNSDNDDLFSIRDDLVSDDEDDPEIRQIEREYYTNAYFRFVPISEDNYKTLRSKLFYYKRQAVGTLDEPETKRPRIADEDDIPQAQNANLDDILDYMRKQIQLAEQMSEEINTF
jgi:hypothetical protein